MSAELIDGKAVAAKLLTETASRAARLTERGLKPRLAAIIAGEDPASESYIRGKEKALAEAGMAGDVFRLAASVNETELITLIRRLNADAAVHGILVQLPLPPHIHEERIIGAIDPAKDVDCFHPVSLGNLVRGGAGFLPCTPAGIIHLLAEKNIPTSGSHVVIVGRSNIVGKPLALLLARRENNATVTLCHTGTRCLAEHSRSADILVATAGTPRLIRGDMIREGAAVIDVGVNRVLDPSAKKGYRLCGDVVFEEAREKARWITPVPGGVGPMTIAALLRNVLLAAERAAERGAAS